MNKSIHVNINGTVVLAKAGTLLSDILDIEKPCGGKGSCGKCRVRVNGRDELACRYVITSNIEVVAPQREEILSETGITPESDNRGRLCLALDVGTTTLALALVSLDKKKTLKVITATNPQRRFGADVISRIEHCQQHSVKALHDTLIQEINRMIGTLGVTVETMYVSANVTMLHTFFGVDCSSIGVAPYTPVFLESKRERGEALGLLGVEHVISLPSISTFVGADVVAGLHLVGMPSTGKYNLLLDLGTNAEIVLYSNRSGAATAAAAGPCFEGANIGCGMSATKGAIHAFRLNYGCAEWETVEHAPPRGICGTGLIDLVAELLKNGILDETGYMAEDYQICEGVFLSPEDVRQYQSAKAAVYSAILTLMKTEGVSFHDIEHMYISGGFSARINIANAAVSGLLPGELVHKAVALNNSSLRGTVKYACEGGDLSPFTEGIRSVDLSSHPDFSDLFVEHMSFEA